MEPLRQPVVLVEIDRDSVTLNGALVDRIDEADSWIVGIQAVCSTVAVPLGRPVWAEVSEPGGTTRLAVHPDGSISHVQQLDLPFVVPDEADAEAGVPLALVPAPAVIEAPAVQPEAPEPHDELAAFLARSALAQTVHVPRPRAPHAPRAQHAPRPPQAPHSPHASHPPHSERHRGAPRPHPVAHRTTPVLGVAALVTVAVMAALLVTRGDDPPQAADEPTSPAAVVKDVLPARVQLRDRFPRNLDVHVIPHAASVEIRVEASRLPVRAVIVLRSADGGRVEREVMLRTAVTQLRLGAVPAGSVDWVVRVAGAETETGSVTIPEAPTETTTAPDPEPEPSEPQSPAEPTSSEPSEPLTPIDPDEEPTGPVDPDELVEGP